MLQRKEWLGPSYLGLRFGLHGCGALKLQPPPRMDPASRLSVRALLPCCTKSLHIFGGAARLPCNPTRCPILSLVRPLLRLGAWTCFSISSGPAKAKFPARNSEPGADCSFLKSGLPQLPRQRLAHLVSSSTGHAGKLLHTGSASLKTLLCCPPVWTKTGQELSRIVTGGVIRGFCRVRCFGVR